MSIWDSLFAHMRQPVAQILFTRNDIADRSQYINAQNTLNEVLAYGVIPIVNENDTLAVSEIKFGDNDTLSAITAAMVHADYLFLMTDVEALYTRNPRLYPDAMPIRVVDDIDDLAVDVSSRGSDLGTGGMATKITAARLATSAGTATIITKSSKPGNIMDIINYYHPPEAQKVDKTDKADKSETSSLCSSQESLLEPPLHTCFLPSSTPIRNRAFWILHGLAPHGTIYVDRGASKALHEKAGLLPVGIVDVEGSFNQQEAVRIVVVDRKIMGTLDPAPPEEKNDRSPSPTNSMHSANGRTSKGSLALHRSVSDRGHVLTLKGEEIGRAVVNYSSAEIQRIKGLRSSEIAPLLGYADSEYVAFRENISLHAATRPGTPTARPSTPTMASAGSFLLGQSFRAANGGSVTPIGYGRESRSRSYTGSGFNSKTHSPERGSLELNLKELRFDDIKKRGSIASVLSLESSYV